MKNQEMVMETSWKNILSSMWVPCDAQTHQLRPTLVNGKSSLMKGLASREGCIRYDYTRNICMLLSLLKLWNRNKKLQGCKSGFAKKSEN